MGFCVALVFAGYATESLLGNSRFRFVSAQLGRRSAVAEPSPTSSTDIWFLLASHRPEFREVQRVEKAQLL